MIALDLVQGSESWVNARVGIPTASCFDRLVTVSGEPSKQRLKYMYTLAGERITGKKEDSYQNSAMLRGIELEDEARKLYELTTDDEVKTVGICYANEDMKYACSPDGLIGDDGGIEIKVPSLAVHVEYLLSGKMPSEYFQQVQGNMYVTGRKFWIFMSYTPGIRPLIIRVERDEKFIAALDHEINKFCLELEQITEKIK